MVIIPQPTGPERRKPADGVDPRCAAVGRPKSTFGASHDTVDRHDPHAPHQHRIAAVETVVAIVSHYENAALWHGHRAEIIGNALVGLIEHDVAAAVRKRL